LYPGREVSLGGDTVVRRLLPNLGRRLVGPWCFVDHYGPDDITSGVGMSVPPHPHIGLQTVSWLVAGEVHHRDSLGNDAVIRAGELGLMTAGRGIAHAEHSPEPAQPTPRTPVLHGVQLWVALPDASRATEPGWAHHAALPVLAGSGFTATVIMGEVDGVRSPGGAFTPIAGLDLTLSAGGSARLPLEPDFEYAALSMLGAVDVDGVGLSPGSMLYLGCGRRELAAVSDDGARVLLLGGEPFEEQIVMWWNFVARSGEEIAAARDAWESGGFGRVAAAGDATPAPPMPAGRLTPRGGTRR
jgi:redox-sensitive bicupin YhaK (pirin superfamily)